MQGNNVGGQNQFNPNMNPNMQQPVGNVSNSNTNHINNISAVADNNRQVNMNNNMANPNVVPNGYNNQGNQGMPYGQGGYVEPPKKKGSSVTFLIIFIILAGAAIGGYFAGTYIYNVTHQVSE